MGFIWLAFSWQGQQPKVKVCDCECSCAEAGEKHVLASVLSVPPCFLFFKLGYTNPNLPHNQNVSALCSHVLLPTFTPTKLFYKCLAAIILVFLNVTEIVYFNKPEFPGWQTMLPVLKTWVLLCFNELQSQDPWLILTVWTFLWQQLQYVLISLDPKLR